MKKRYCFLCIILLLSLLVTGCLGNGCSCSKKEITEEQTETPTETASETLLSQVFTPIGIGLQELKTIDLPPRETLTDAQTLNAALRSVLISNSYKNETDKYCRFSMLDSGLIVLTSKKDSLVLKTDPNRFGNLSLAEYDDSMLMDLHTDGTFEVYGQSPDALYTAGLKMIDNIAPGALESHYVWKISTNLDKSIAKYFIYEKKVTEETIEIYDDGSPMASGDTISDNGKITITRTTYEQKEVSYKDFLKFKEKYSSPYSEWHELNEENIDRYFPVDSPAEYIYPADFSDYSSVLMTLRGICEIFMDASAEILSAETVDIANYPDIPEKINTYKNIFYVPDRDSFDILDALFSAAYNTYRNTGSAFFSSNDFTYCMKDLNSDGLYELILMIKSSNTFLTLSNVFPHSILAVFTMTGDKVALLSTYDSRSCLLADGSICYLDNNVFAASKGNFFTIEKISKNLTTDHVLTFGRSPYDISGDEEGKYFYKLENMTISEISDYEYADLYKQYTQDFYESYQINILNVNPASIFDKELVVTRKDKVTDSTN